MICDSEGSKSKPAKAAGAEPSGQISGFALPSVIHNNLSYRFPFFETSATALCGAAMLCRPLQASESFDFKSVCVRVAQLVALVATVATAAASS